MMHGSMNVNFTSILRRNNRWSLHYATVYITVWSTKRLKLMTQASI